MSYDIIKTEIHKKVWGEEHWIVNNGLYCGKMLIVEPWHYCSIHRHMMKDETFHIIHGEIVLELFSDCDGSSLPDTNDKVFKQLLCGDTVRINPGQWHRFTCVTHKPAQILEISTSHSNDDVRRLEESGKWNEERILEWIFAVLEDNKQNNTQ